MQDWMQDVPRAMMESKRRLRRDIDDLPGRFAAVGADVLAQVEEVREAATRGRAVPELAFAQIAAAAVDDGARALIRRRGCVVIRDVFDDAEVTAWNAEIGEYITRNDYLERSRDKAGMDRYFSNLVSGRPQIFGLYWSRPQVLARQHANMARTKAFLNGLWDNTSEGGVVFDPNRDLSYADRLRRREPGDQSFGLSPHVDGGSVERWCDPSFHQVYKEVLFGDPQAYNPFRARGRTLTHEIPSPAVCSAFRTFQGWTALTPQGPGDGTLKLMPIANAIPWILLRALQDDVPEDDLCGAQPGRALSVNARWHELLMAAEVSIPPMQPGDTVWWHTDVCHSVEELHRGAGYSNVIYIGAAPWCEKNARYAQRQAQAFLSGSSAPDFAAEDYETDFAGRATEADLTDLGARQMGLKPW
jgi:hypothetical protein